MIAPEPVLKARLRWMQLYAATQNVALTRRRCGISKPLRHVQEDARQVVATLSTTRRGRIALGEPSSSQVA